MIMNIVTLQAIEFILTYYTWSWPGNVLDTSLIIDNLQKEGIFTLKKNLLIVTFDMIYQEMCTLYCQSNDQLATRSNEGVTCTVLTVNVTL